jgi:hypothetical protein
MTIKNELILVYCHLLMVDTTIRLSRRHWRNMYSAESSYPDHVNAYLTHLVFVVCLPVQCVKPIQPGPLIVHAQLHMKYMVNAIL